MAKYSEIVIDGYPVVKYQPHGKNYRQLRKYLIKQYGRCYFCNTPVKDYPHVEGKGLEPDSATIEHILPRQFRHRGDATEKVLACHKCNTERNDAVQRGEINAI